MRSRRTVPSDRGLAAALAFALALGPGAAGGAPEPFHFVPRAGGEIPPGAVDHANGLWHRFGAVDDGSESVARFGNEPAYFEWLGLKIMWRRLAAYRAGFRRRLLEFPMSEDGYVWSWGNQHTWPTGDGSSHQENNAKYILGVWRYCAWSGDFAFLDAVDSTTAENARRPAVRDVSKGATVWDKLCRAMDYQLERIGGSSGLIRIENGLNTGRARGHPTNYWDNFPFGGADAYCSIYFTASLEALAQLAALRGEDDRAARLRGLRRRAVERFRACFWDDEKGRFIGCIDDRGRRRDLGFVFLNLEAIFYGLADDAQARRVLAWIAGQRVIEGDRSRGADIYRFAVAPRSTTRAVEDDGTPRWWFSLNGAIEVDRNARYGEHLENGGAIFYTSFYDIVARARVRGTDDAWARYEAILREYGKDGLLRDPKNSRGAAWVLGITGEFPESGLPAAVPLYAFLGAEATPAHLRLQPALPGKLSRLEVRGVAYQGAVLDLRLTETRLVVRPVSAGERAVRLRVIDRQGEATDLAISGKDPRQSSVRGSFGVSLPPRD